MITSAALTATAASARALATQTTSGRRTASTTC